MSRSRRKTCIAGISNKTSNKSFKQAEHRRERHAVKQQLHCGYDEYELVHPRKYGNEWDSPRDGKMYFGDLIQRNVQFLWYWCIRRGKTIEQIREEQLQEYKRLMRK